MSSHEASVSGLKKLNTRRLRGSGSRRLVNRVSTPVLSYKNGSGRMTAGSSAGIPSLYFSDCHSTPVSVVPSGFASIAPTALPPT